MFKKVLTAGFAAALLLNAAASAPARTLVAQDPDAAAAKVEAAVARLGTGPEARVEVKLKTGAKLKGYVSEATAEQFTVLASDGRATRVAYAEVEGVKAVKPKPARKRFDQHGLFALGVIGGVFAVALFYVSQTK
jgi:hypothetical protein